MRACPHHQHINLPDVSSANVSPTSQESVPLQTPRSPGIDQSQDDLNMGAWDMHDHGNQGYEGSRSPPHPSSFELPISQIEKRSKIRLAEHATAARRFYRIAMFLTASLSSISQR